jgi:adenylate kinase family enzyme
LRYCQLLDKYNIHYAKLLDCQVEDNCLIAKQERIIGQSISNYLYQHIADGYVIDDKIRGLYVNLLEYYFTKILNASYDIRVDCKLHNLMFNKNKIILVDITPPLFSSDHEIDKSFHYSTDVQIKQVVSYFLKPFILLSNEESLKDNTNWFVKKLEKYLDRYGIKSDNHNDKFYTRFNILTKYNNGEIDFDQLKTQFKSANHNSLIGKPIPKYDKIHIIGGPCAGKSYIVDRLVDKTVYCTMSLDDIYWKNNIETFGVKEDQDVRDQKLIEFVSNNDKYIVEGSYINEWLKPSLDRADTIFVIGTEYNKIKKVLWKRFWRRKFGLEKTSKKETIKSIRELIKWARQYQSKLDNSINDGVLSKYKDKIVLLNNNIEIYQYLV